MVPAIPVSQVPYSSVNCPFPLKQVDETVVGDVGIFNTTHGDVAKQGPIDGGGEQVKLNENDDVVEYP
jgi:hypothetical protein